MSNNELAEYQRKLYELLYTDSEAILPNYSQEHAKCIIRAFLDAAENTIVFLSGDFGAGIYKGGEIRDSLAAAVRRGVDVRVISLGQDDASKECLAKLDAELHPGSEPPVKGRFSYKLGVVREGAQIQHYMVVDSKRYRLESYHEMPVPDSVHAEVCCNGKAKAAMLTNMFNTVWNRI